MKLKPIILSASCLVFGAAISVSAGTVDYVGSSVGSWTPYAGGTGLGLNTASPAAITNSGSTFRYDRTTDANGTVTAGAWKPGDSYNMFFSGSLATGVNLRMEFADSVNRHNGITVSLLNGSSTDTVQAIGLFGGSTVTLFSGAANGPITADLSFNIVSSTSANIVGTISDSNGTLWSSVTTPATMTLGPDTNPIYSAFNMNPGLASGITGMHWTYTAAPVPEPQTWALMLVALAGFGFWRRGTSAHH